MKTALVLAVLLGGCSRYTDRRVGQDRALEIVWVGLYGMPIEAAPTVEWVHGQDLIGHTDGFTYAGWKVVVADKDGASISASAFAHELMHYRTFLMTGDVDAAHRRGDWSIVDSWAPGGTSCELDKEGL